MTTTSLALLALLLELIAILLFNHARAAWGNIFCIAGLVLATYNACKIVLEMSKGE